MILPMPYNWRAAAGSGQEKCANARIASRREGPNAPGTSLALVRNLLRHESNPQHIGPIGCGPDSSRLKVYKAVFEPKVTQDASELGVGVVFVSSVDAE
jgi:hypothetical protein